MRTRQPMTIELIRDGYVQDPCDEKVWNERGDLASILGVFFDADGVMFDCTLKEWGSGNIYLGFVYSDRKQRFYDGWRIWTSKIMNVSEPTEWPESLGEKPDNVRIVKTLYSTYVVFLQEQKDDAAQDHA